MTELTDVTPANRPTARKLLAAARELDGYDESVVEGPFKNGFRVPIEVAELAFSGKFDDSGAVVEAEPVATADPDGDSRDTDAPEGTFVDLAADAEGYEPAFDKSIPYADLAPADKAKRTKKINELEGGN